MLTCTRRFRIDAGHRVYLHESKCANLHGHSYEIFCTATAPELDTVGRIIDFSEIKARLGTWLDDHWDHGTILYSRDPLCELFQEGGPLADHKHYIMPYNPTAEFLSKYLLEVICPRIFSDTKIVITAIRVWETENCYASCDKLS